MLRRGAKRARDRCQPGYRTRSVQQRQRKVWEIQVSVELRVSKCERIVIVPIPATIQPRTSKESAARIACVQHWPTIFEMPGKCAYAYADTDAA